MKAMFLLACLAAPLAWGDAPAAFDHSHAAWDGWLKKYVTVKGSASTVNYKGAKADGTLAAYVGTLSAVTEAQYNSFGEQDRLAFLINAYNAFTVKLILDNYPVKSIKDLGSLFKSPWKKEFFQLFGKGQTLDGIEHGMIRKQFKEPRIHMAVVCASIGCPMLRNEAWVGSRLDAQFDAAVKGFLADSSRNRYDEKENRFYVSKIFDWYGGDFKDSAGSVAKFLARYYGDTPEKQARMAEAKVSHNDYDWNLNETP